MRSIVLCTPKGLPQRMQWNGSCWFLVTGLRAASVKLSRGTSAITDSGQVVRHRPHCTQASSLKPSQGRSGLSSRAPVGQAPTQARQSVQPLASTSTAPKGAPAGSGRISTWVGACVCRCRSASMRRVRLPPMGKKLLAGAGARGARS